MASDALKPVGRTRIIVVWALTIIAAAAFAGAGFMKVSGAEEMGQTFARWGLPVWFMTVVGIGELAAAIGLLIPPVAALAAMGLGGIMFGALVTHALHDPFGAMIPALVLLVLTLAIACLRLGQFARAAGRLAAAG